MSRTDFSGPLSSAAIWIRFGWVPPASGTGLENAGPALPQRTSSVAVWASGAYGTDPERCDSTFVVLSFRVSENTSAYVQFLSDPLHRTVLWEVSSLDYQPGLTDRLTPDRQAALVARGFETGASPSNYRREVVIDSDASAGEVAHGALDILFEVLGYRGEEAIVLHVEAERVAADGKAPGGFEPGRFVVLLRQEGYSLRVVRGAEPTEDRRLEVRFGDDVVLTVASAADGRSFRVFTRLARLAGGDAPARAKLVRAAALGYPEDQITRQGWILAGLEDFKKAQPALEGPVRQGVARPGPGART